MNPHVSKIKLQRAFAVAVASRLQGRKALNHGSLAAGRVGTPLRQQLAQLAHLELAQPLGGVGD